MLRLRDCLVPVVGLGGLIACMIIIQFRWLAWYIAFPAFALVFLAAFIFKMRITYKGYDLAVAYKKNQFCLCIRCGYTLTHQHDPCTECGDVTPPADRDAWWDEFIRHASGETEIEPGKVPLEKLPAPALLLADRRRNRTLVFGLALTLTGAFVVETIYLNWIPSGMNFIIVIVMSTLFAFYQNFQARYQSIAQIYLTHNLAFCLRCGKQLPHTHAPCPHCGDTASPAQRDAQWSRLLAKAYLPMPKLPPAPPP